MNEKSEYWFENLLDELLENAYKDFKGTEEEFINKLSKLDFFADAQEIIEEKGLKYLSKAIIKLRKKELKYENEIDSIYSEGLILFEIFIKLSSFYGSHIIELLKKKEISNLRIVIYNKLFSKGCQIAYEILKLLRTGYPDGAHARWRALHELCVMLLFLDKGNDELIDKYCDYQVVEKLKRAYEFQKHYHKINWRPIENDVLEHLQTQKDALIEKYGKDFSKNYGWAYSIINSCDFRKIEEYVELDYMRAFYSWASDNIHPGMSGLVDRIGDIELEISSNYFAGKSKYGLADPAQFTAYSLYFMLDCIAQSIEGIGNELILTTIGNIQKQLSQKLIIAQNNMKNNSN